MSAKCFDGQSGRVIGAIASTFPKFSSNVLQHLIETDPEEALTSALCPVWSGNFKAKGIYATEIYHFCYGCKVKKEHCPAYKFDIRRLRFKTFQREDEGLISARERIRRLTESPYLPINPLMFASLTEKQRDFLYDLTEGIREEGVMTCDAFMYTKKTDSFTLTLSKENRLHVRTFLERGSKDCFVTSFYNRCAIKQRNSGWTVRDNALDFQTNSPTYSVVIEE